MTTVLVRAKYDTDKFTKGNHYEMINDAGHYYWCVFLGEWVDKDLFERVN